MPTTLFATQYEVLEWSYASPKVYDDPFNEVELDIVITHELGQEWRLPAYWAGGQEWRARFAPPLPGSYQAVGMFSDGHTSTALEIQAAIYQGQDPLLIQGPVQAVPGQHTLQFADGTPFFWLGDTWWMGLCKRLTWPDEFQQLTAWRVSQGFSVVQIVAGLYPDMPGFDPRGANEAGFPWESDESTQYARINPAYFDMADLRIRWLARSGLIPCVVAAWGYYLPLLGIEKMKKHWRNLVARWSAYPVIWCLAGEVVMPYYLSEDKPRDVEIQRQGWIEIARYLRSIDPYRRLVTIHDHVLDETLQDLNMLQTGHSGYRSLANTVTLVRQAYEHTPVMPVIVGEANYEAIIHGTGDDNQRLTFWASILSGACGHTYGANGLWQLNGKSKPYGASPWGGSWGGPNWQDAAHQPGAAQLGMAKKFLERYDWQRFEPHSEWVTPCATPENVDRPFAAGIPGEVRVIYFYWPTFQAGLYRVTALESDITYRAFFWNPRSGQEHELGIITPEPDGSWPVPIQPELKDWVLVFERVVPA